MDKDNEYRKYFRDEELERGEVSYEVPAEQKPPFKENIPSGYDPMGRIYLGGRAYENISGGNSPWWVIVSSWVVFGTPALYLFFWSLFTIVSLLREIFTTGLTISNFVLSLFLLLGFLCSFSMFSILWRGTVSKLSQKRKRNRLNPARRDRV